MSEANNDPTTMRHDMEASQQSSEWRFKDEPKLKKQNATRELKVIPLAAYQWCIDERVKRWHTYVASYGCDFENKVVFISFIYSRFLFLIVYTRFCDFLMSRTLTVPL